MPTLDEYKARGVDITYMTQEQLQAEGYITPLNEMPVLVDGPGWYLTRNGRSAEVLFVKETTTLSTTAFNATGYVYYKNGKGRQRSTWTSWHVSGRCTAGSPDSWDIIRKVEK